MRYIKDRVDISAEIHIGYYKLWHKLLKFDKYLQVTPQYSPHNHQFTAHLHQDPLTPLDAAPSDLSYQVASVWDHTTVTLTHWGQASMDMDLHKVGYRAGH